MLAKEFYDEIADEIKAVAFLRKHGLLVEEENVAPCQRCGEEMKDVRRRNRKGEFTPTLRCKNSKCQSYRSIRRGNVFFHFTGLNDKVNCRLTLCQILELIFYFIKELPYNMVHTLTGRGNEAICDWFNLSRKICSQIVSATNRGKMVGTTEEPVQIEETIFAGRRKCNGGRILQGDQAPDSIDSEAEVENNRNYGRGVDGPWIFGLKKGDDCRYFYVPLRNENTLIPIIQREVEENSVIHSDECPLYSNLIHLNYNHQIVNHQEDSKNQILHRMRGIPANNYQSHLDYFCWRKMRKSSDDLFLAFLSDIVAINQ